MVILVSDTSVLIDLERGLLLEEAFGCGLAMAVPDILYEQELADFNGPHLRSLGLGVVSLSATEVQTAQDIGTARPGLTVPDAFALTCATRPDHTLVTGDKLLRSEATARKVPVVGLLGLLDRMLAARVDSQVLHDGLQRIAAHTNCRLPTADVKARLAAWEK